MSSHALEDAPLASGNKHKTKTPIIYIATTGVSKNVLEKHLFPVLEGMSRLNVKIHSTKNGDLNKALSQAHMLLLLSSDKELLEKAWKKGVVTITFPFNPNIQDYNPNTEKGNSFVYRSINQWEIFAAVVRAVETFKFPYDWKFLTRSCKKSV
jgi:hypothetical protein